MGLLKVLIPSVGGHLAGDAWRTLFTVDIASDGEGLVAHAGAALLAEVADRVGLTRALSEGLAGCASVAAATTRGA